MKKLLPVAHKSAMLLAMLFAAFSANASDITTWEPSTAAGGAPVPPGYWDQRASYRFFPTTSMMGGSIVLSNSNTSLTDNSTGTSYTDFSTHNSRLTDNSTNTTNTSSSGSQVNYNPVSNDGSTLTNTNTTTITP